MIDSGDFDYSTPSRNRTRKPDSGASLFFLWLGRFIVIAMIMIAPWCFGSVSQEAQAWMMRLAVAGLVCWWFSMAFGKRSGQVFPYLAFPLILGIVLVGFQMVPLPDSLSAILAPHQAELYDKFASPVEGELLQESVNLAVVPRVTMDLDGTAKMFNLMIMALVCLILGCHFFNSRRIILWLPFFMTLNGVAISIYGMVQRLGNDASIYGIELAYNVQPFGPFINKNNAAGYLLLCLAGSLALVFGAFHWKTASGQRPKPIITNEYPVWKQLSLHIGLFIAELNATRLAAILASAVIGTGILFTLSRGGILAMGVGLATTAIYFCMIRKSSIVLIGVIGLGLLVIGLLGFLGVGDQVANRLGSLSDAELLTNDKRMNHWIQTAPAIGEFSPLGSGVGSYLNVHRLYRVDSEVRVFYFAENQYFQTLVEAGIPGLLLLLMAIALLILCVRFLAIRGNSPKTIAVCIFGCFLIPSQLLAAFLDFGLFIPSNTILMAVACGFVAGQAHSLADRLKKKYAFRFNLPRVVAFPLLLALFTVTLFSLLSCERYSRIEQRMGKSPHEENYLTLDLPATEQRIDELKQALERLPDSQGLARLAELYIYRYRMQLFGTLVDDDISFELMDSTALDRNWLSTGVDRLHNLVYQARNAGRQQQVNALVTDPLVSENLLPAVYYLQQSRGRSPLRPSTHLLLAQLHGISATPDTDVTHMQRSLELAPANATTALICGILDLQAGRTESACQHLQKCLAIDRANYRKVMQVAIPYLSPENIVEEILPEDPLLMYSFATSYLMTRSMEPLKLDIYRRVVTILKDEMKWDRRSLRIRSQLQEELGDLKGAIETQRLAVDLNPSEIAINYRLAQLLHKNGELDKALLVARAIVRNSNDLRYRNYLKRLEREVEARDRVD